MKVVVLNRSGNVGKTTIAGQLLFPRMSNPKFFELESINSGAGADGIDVEKMKGKKFGELLDAVMVTDNVIVDVGSSNVEDFQKLMQQYDGSHEEFDFFVVPVTSEKKVMIDSVQTIAALKLIGVPKKKIRMVFNKVDVDDDVETEFAPMFGLEASEKSFIIKNEAVIYKNDAFELMKSVQKSLAEVANDETDYRGLLRQAIGVNQEEEDRCKKMIALKRLGVTVNKNLDDVYKVLFK